ncbi:MAG: hypothetical protein HMLKMBBP_01355 [Planctomycetes bacterium]|nr:hypothetical protein [Planctomycetota bacterium]
MHDCTCGGCNPDCFHCGGLGYVSSRRPSALVIQSEHLPPRPTLRSCRVCGQIYTRIERHMRTCHGVLPPPDDTPRPGAGSPGSALPPPPNCPKCGTAVRSLKRHECQPRLRENDSAARRASRGPASFMSENLAAQIRRFMDLSRRSKSTGRCVGCDRKGRGTTVRWDRAPRAQVRLCRSCLAAEVQRIRASGETHGVWVVVGVQPDASRGRRSAGKRRGRHG